VCRHDFRKCRNATRQTASKVSSAGTLLSNQHVLAAFTLHVLAGA
jgi:hypothetical protein